MPMYKVVVSFTVEAENEEDATHVAQDMVYDPTVSVDAVTELKKEENEGR